MNLLIHCIPILFCVYISFLCVPGTTLFSFHPFCMSLAYGLFMTEAVLSFSTASIWNPRTPRSTLLYYHWLLNSLAGILALFGFVLMYWNKNRKGLDHFLTYHGLIGLICVIYTLIQLTAGLVLKYPSFIPKWLPYRVLKKLHSISGFIAYSLGVLVLSLSFASTWYMNNSYPYFYVGFICFYVYILFGLLRHIMVKWFKL